MKPLAYETRHARGGVLPTHRHHRPYAALVIDGSYTECSLDGPLICERGTIVVHPPFHAHGDRFGCHGARVINVDLPATLAAIEATAWRAHDLDEAREVFEHCPQRLPQLLECARPAPPSELSAWQRDLLTLLRECEDEVSALAKRAGLVLRMRVSVRAICGYRRLIPALGRSRSAARSSSFRFRVR